MTMVTDGLTHLGNLTSLTSLNMAWNCLTVDNARHASVFATGLATLTKLKYLNLAHNRLQDKGLSIMHSEILPNMLELQHLDVGGCFITPSSFRTMEAILRRPGIALKVFKLAGNIITEKDKGELKYVSHMVDIRATW